MSCAQGFMSFYISSFYVMKYALVQNGVRWIPIPKVSVEGTGYAFNCYPRHSHIFA